MKINELIGYKNNDVFRTATDLDSGGEIGYTKYNQNAADSLENKLKDFGWTLLGKGYAGLVFSNPNKSYVIKLYQPESRNDMKFLNFVVSNQDNPHLPKLRGKPVKLENNSSVYMTRMEKLAPITSETGPIFSQYLPNNQDSVYDLFEEEGREYIKANHPYLYQVIEFIDNLPDEPDFHLDNIMARNNTLVLIDI